MSGHAFINHKNQKKREKNGLQKCGQSITDWKKGRKKFRLSTEFGKNPEEELPFPEYPRPQMRRENWTNLNGWWEYAFTETQKMPKQRDGKILVPFSPECDASGVKRQLLPKEYLWYFRTIQLPKIPAGKRLLLQFGAVDQDAVIYCNGKRAGYHLGGYLSFQWILRRISKRERTSLPSRCAMRRTRTGRGPRKAEPYPGRHVLHRAERHLAERLDGMGAGDVSGTHRDHAGI